MNRGYMETHRRGSDATTLDTRSTRSAADASDRADPLGVRYRRTWLAQQSWASRSAIVGALIGVARVGGAVRQDRQHDRHGRRRRLGVTPRSGSARTCCSTRPATAGSGSTSSRSGRSARCSGSCSTATGSPSAPGEGFLTWVVGPLARRRGVRRHRFPAGRRPTTRSGVAIISIGGMHHRRRRSALLIREEYYPELDWRRHARLHGGRRRGSARGLSAAAKRPPADGALIGAAHRLGARVLGRCRLGDGSIGTSVLACRRSRPCCIGARLGVHDATPTDGRHGTSTGDPVP